MGLRGDRSGARLHSPLDLLAPREPYHPDPARPWRRGEMGLWEIPAASLLGGFPLVGTFLGLLPRAAALFVGLGLSRRPFVTVELHGIDLVDPRDGGLDALVGRQLGLSAPWARRRSAFAALLGQLLGRGQGAPLCEQVR
ncbi:MAG: hypothetical protein RBU30_25025, partial [Polyangia bacterium]|nr:hypothetical protein [Polyangia bacterium]